MNKFVASRNKRETRNSSLQETGYFGKDGRFSRCGGICLMDGDSVLGTDMACTGEEDDSTVGLEYDGRRSCSGNGDRSSAVPRNGMRFSLIFSGPCKSRIFANPHRKVSLHVPARL